jgi:tetratricopeptide (TPR) repeat protein
VLHYNAGVGLAARGDLAAAEAAFTKAIDSWGGRAEIYVERGFVRHRRLRYLQALEDLEKAIALDPDFPLAYFRIGGVYRTLERNREAIDAYTAAIELTPDYASAFNNRAWTYLQNDEVEKAVQDANAALSLEPKSAYYDTRGWAYFYQGDYPRSKEDALAALEMEPYSFFTRALLYRLNAMEYGTETASQTLRSYLSRLPEEQRQRDDLLLLLYLVGDVSLGTVKQSPYWVDYSTALKPAQVRR